MNISLRMPRLGFQAKVLILVILVMMQVVASSLWMVNGRITAQLQMDMAQRLLTSDEVFRYSMQIRARNLLERCGNVRNEPRFKAVTQLGEAKTVRFFLKELIDEFDTDVVLFTGDDGAFLAGAVRPPLTDAAAFVPALDAGLQQAMRGKDTTDIVGVGDRIYEVVYLPVAVGEKVMGVLTLGRALDDAAVRELSRLTDSEVVLVTHGAVAAATFKDAALARSVASIFEEDRHAAGDAERVRDVVLSGRHYRYVIGALTSAPEGGLAYLLTSSYEQPLQALRATQRMLVVVGLLGVLLSSTLLWFLVRTVTRPLVELRDSAEAVGRGDFSRRVIVSSRDECGELAGVFNRMTDSLRASREELEKSMTNLKSAQSQLIQSEKLSGIGEFVAGVTHELNNPLTSVIGFAELLKASDIDARHMQDIREIYNAAQRCRKIVQSLLSFARQHEPERKLISLNETVEASIDIFRYELRTSNISVSTELAPHLPPVMADPYQLQQVILNIVNNARQAIEGWRSNGSLCVRTELAGKSIRLTIKDDGPGIAPENIGKLFDPFFTTKEAGRGTGLGLSISYGIIQQHGGSISVTSKPGDGALFTIELPAAEGQAEPAAKDDAPAAAILPAPATRVRRVLVVDDEDSIASLVRRVLVAARYEVDVASDGRAALDKIQNTEYDLILCDWKMPGFSGKQVIDEMLARHPAAVRRLVFMSGDVMGESRDMIEETGALFLAKPFTSAEVQAMATRILAGN